MLSYNDLTWRVHSKHTWLPINYEVKIAFFDREKYNFIWNESTTAEARD